MITIRTEISADIAAVYQINHAAFGRKSEADLADALRRNGNALHSLVAVDVDQVVGHIMVSPTTIVDGDQTWSAVAIGPVAVAPARQGQGIGGQLVRAALDACRAQGHPLLFLLGHPTYYPRFGFIPAQPHGIRLTFKVSIEAFMVIELQPNALDGKRGVMSFSPEFDG